MKYKIGDKVRVISKPNENGFYYMSGGPDFNVMNSIMYTFMGKEVTISKYTKAGEYKIKEDNGEWNWTDEMFTGLTSSFPKIVITTDGKTTTAKMFDGKKLLKAAMSKCSPKDTFDFAIGAKIALERVTEKEREFKVGQFVKVIDSSTSNFPEGQIVEVVRVNKDCITCRGYCLHVHGVAEQFLDRGVVEALTEDGE